MSGLLTFSGDIEKEHWHKMDQRKYKCKVLPNMSAWIQISRDFEIIRTSMFWNTNNYYSINNSFSPMFFHIVSSWTQLHSFSWGSFDWISCIFVTEAFAGSVKQKTVSEILIKSTAKHLCRSFETVLSDFLYFC